MDPAFDPRIFDFPVPTANNNDKQKRPYHSSVRFEFKHSCHSSQQGEERQRYSKRGIKEQTESASWGDEGTLSAVGFGHLPTSGPKGEDQGSNAPNVHDSKTILFRAIEYIQHANNT